MTDAAVHLAIAVIGGAAGGGIYVLAERAFHWIRRGV